MASKLVMDMSAGGETHRMTSSTTMKMTMTKGKR
jgi:hypothetical protein